jgi:hypothetical protein
LSSSMQLFLPMFRRWNALCRSQLFENDPFSTIFCTYSTPNHSKPHWFSFFSIFFFVLVTEWAWYYVSLHKNHALVCQLVLDYDFRCDIGSVKSPLGIT